jgi:hypothetical protein
MDNEKQHINGIIDRPLKCGMTNINFHWSTAKMASHYTRGNLGWISKEFPCSFRVK